MLRPALIMQSLALTPADTELIAAAKALIAQRYLPDRHHLAAAIRSSAGQIITGLHVEANVGRVTVCARRSRSGVRFSGSSALETIVAVRVPTTIPRVLPSSRLRHV
ncbi:hypothetical protein HC891_05290, partial [Candidatus Gracilibacteria bacterium]|nr:hypothetical protein [Candidatus Gracilibacteria bacterium]